MRSEWLLFFESQSRNLCHPVPGQPVLAISGKFVSVGRDCARLANCPLWGPLTLTQNCALQKWRVQSRRYFANYISAKPQPMSLKVFSSTLTANVDHDTAMINRK